ncbi:hypothetical protein LWI28_007536 [Acer negundo]|uniref:Carbonic anhydrase n=1 Tax=Acer negundo TaxID=4023 RepID=A0AAD5NDK7_ACENE|nr:hypothetical protein LWI28_007536 [Acer negundo]
MNKILFVGSVDFSYSGATGPSNWGTLKPEYTLCSSGLQQSPVNIIQEYTVLNQNLKLSKQYDVVANATLIINSVFQIELKYDGDIGGLEINGKNYNFEEMHWHSPSEHLIDGQRFAAELHLVHRAKDRSGALNAILYEFGNSPTEVDPFLAELGDALEMLSENDVTQVDVGMLNTEPLTQNYGKFYRYDGSFTTPPCEEGTIWSILSEFPTNLAVTHNNDTDKITKTDVASPSREGASDQNEEVVPIPGKGQMQNIQAAYRLNGKNYLKWSQVVQTFHKGKGKLSHLLGTGPTKGDPKFEAYDEADSVVMSWLWNSMTL